MKATLEDAKSTLRQLIHTGHTAYLAGGCVRDMLLGIEPNDYDICTSASPEEIQKIFTKTVPVGVSFGVVKVLCNDNRELDVATFRTDGKYSDNRRPDSVSFTKSAEEDVKRRDFTINALLMDVDGNIIDYVGGQQDLKSRILRTVGYPSHRFNEDALRMIRAIRFAIRYKLDIEESTWNTIEQWSTNIRLISSERFTDEFLKIFSNGNCGEAYLRLHTSGIWAGWFTDSPVRGPWEVIRILSRVKSTDDVTLPLTIMSYININAEQELKNRLSLTNVQKSAITSLKEHVSGFPFLERSLAEKRKAARWSDMDLYLRFMDCANGIVVSNYNREATLIEIQAVKDMGWPAPLVTGDTLQTMGFVPGPIFSDLLEEIRDGQLEGTITDINQVRPFILHKYPAIPRRVNGDIIDDTRPRRLIATCPNCGMLMVLEVSKNLLGKYNWSVAKRISNIWKMTTYLCYSNCCYSRRFKTSFVPTVE